MTSQPFLQSPFENRLWRRLNGGGILGRFAATNGAVQSCLDDLSKSEGKVGSPLLTSLMEHLDSESGATFESLSKIVLKSRSRDCMASVRASEMMLSKGDINAARELLSMSSSSKEVLHRSLMDALISQAEGDLVTAKARAEEAYRADPGCMQVYDVLEKVDPDGDWAVRHNIQDILSSRRPSAPASEGRAQLLYKIYYEWFNGNREAATDMMVRSRHQSENDPEFILASARMSADEKDWRSSTMMYERIIANAPSFVLREAASAYIHAGDAVRAIELLKMSDPMHPDTMRGFIDAYSEMGRNSEMMDALRAYLDSEWVHADDWIDAVNSLLDKGMKAEAEGILSTYTRSMGGDPSALTAKSAIQMASGEYPAALFSASEAVHLDKDSIPARIQLARVRFAMGRTGAAEKDCDRILAQDPGNRMALGLMRDMCTASGDHEKAVGICRMILENDPRDPKAMMDLAESMMGAGQKGDSVDMWNRALRMDGSKDSYVRAASAMIRAGLYTDAVFICRDGEAEHPQDVMLKRLRGNAEYALGAYFKASVAFADALGLDNGNPVLWYSKGMADEMRDDLESAEASYRRAASIDPTEPEYRTALSVVSERKGDDVSAVRYLNEAIELDPRDPYPVRRKASIFERNGRSKEALGLLGMALVYSPHDRGVLESRMRLQYQAHDYDGALESFRALESPSEESVLQAAECYAVKNMRDSAIVAINDAIVNGGSTPALTDALSRYKSENAHIKGVKPVEMKATIQMGQPPENDIPEEPEAEEAVPEPEEAPKEEKPEVDAEGQYALASSLFAAGDCDGAMRAIEPALAQEPENTKYISLKAEIALRSGDVDAAAFLASTASRSMPDDPSLHFTTGRTRAAKGDMKGAVQAYDEAIALGMDDPDIYLAKAEAYESLGMQDKAVESYSAAYSRDPDLLEVGEKLARMMMSRKELIAADSIVTKILRRNPDRVSAILIKAEIASARSDFKSLEAAYEMYLSSCSQTSDATVALAHMMESAGLATEARGLVGNKDDSHVEDAVKRYAEKALRRAYTMKLSPSDPDITGYMGLDPAMSAKVSAFIAERREYGTITPGTDVFREMERRSLDAVTKLQWKDLESNPELPLDAVFVQCGFRDVDAAKDLVAYIMRAMLTDIGRKADPRLADMSMGLPKGMTVYEIMVECSIGVYEARVVQGQII